jgi:hypothetical protein
MLRLNSGSSMPLLLASVALFALSGCESSGGLRVAGVSGQSAGDGSGTGTGDTGSGSQTGDGSGTTGGDGNSTGTGAGSSGTGDGGGSGTGGTGTGSTGGSGDGSGGTGSQTGQGLLSQVALPGVVGAGGVADTGVLANTGNPSNPGPLGPVLVTAGNAVLGAGSQTPTLVQAVDSTVPGSVPIAGTVVKVVEGTGQALVDAGNGNGYLVDGLTAAVGQAVSLNVLNKDVLPAGSAPLAGVSLASATQNVGTLATVGADAAGNLVKAVVTPLGAGNGAAGAVLPGSTAGATAPLTNALGQVAGATVGTTQLLGSSGTTPLVGASVLSPTQTTGSVATVGVASAGQTATAVVAPVSAVAGTVTNAAAPVTSAVASAAAPVTSGLATVTVGNTTLLNGGAGPLVGASVASPVQAAGTAVTAGVLSAGNAVTAGVGVLTAPLANGVTTTTNGARGLLGGPGGN